MKRFGVLTLLFLIAVVGFGLVRSGFAQPETGTSSEGGSAAELLFWESVKDSEDTADLQAYLDRYPEGICAVLARNRLRRLTASGEPNAPQVPPSPLQGRARQGFADAQNDLGNLLYDQQNFAKAIEWYKLAAEQGHADALNNLGVMHYFGEGVMQSYSDAARLYRKAAEKGHLHAQMNLAFMFFAGEGMPANYVESYAWYSVADRQGVFEAKDAVMSISILLTRVQLLRAQDLAQQYWKDYVLPFQQD